MIWENLLINLISYHWIGSIIIQFSRLIYVLRSENSAPSQQEDGVLRKNFQFSLEICWIKIFKYVLFFRKRKMLVKVVSYSADRKRWRSWWGGYMRTTVTLLFLCDIKEMLLKIVFYLITQTETQTQAEIKIGQIQVCCSLWCKSFMAA